MEQPIIAETIRYLSEVSGVNYNIDYQPTVLLIRGLVKSGYGLDDFKRVIDKKAAEWKDTKYWAYMRPSTLFGTKFENYLNEQPRITNNRIKQLADSAEKAKRTNWRLDKGR